MEDVSNWDDYPKKNPKYTDVHEESSYYVKDITSLMLDISKMVEETVHITPLSSHSKKISKLDLSYSMDIEEEETARNTI